MNAATKIEIVVAEAAALALADERRLVDRLVHPGADGCVDRFPRRAHYFLGKPRRAAALDDMHEGIAHEATAGHGRGNAR